MEITTEEVTPEVADEWLSRNQNNRAVKRGMVDQYARDMAAGRWKVTGEALKFDVDGGLIDGQHRLLAIIKSGVAVPMVVVKGLPSDAQIVLDSGKSRSAGDALKFGGFQSVNQLAAVAKLAIHWTRGDLTSSHVSLPTLSQSEIHDAVRSDPQLQVATSVGNRYTHKRKSAGIHAAPSAIGFAYWLISGVAGADRTLEFLDDLAELRTSGNGDPRLAAIQRLNSAVDRSEQLRNMTQAYVLVVAWNAIQAEKPLTIIKIWANNKPLAFPSPLS